MRSTQKDVAREAGVSEATVSRVLNNSPLVHEATRVRVAAAMERLGYAPSAAARNLSRSRTDTIGVVFHQMSSGFFASVMSAIDAAARESGYHILTALSRDTQEERAICYGMMDETRVDGLLILDSGLSDDSIQRLQACRQPFVLIEREPDDSAITTVAVQNQHGAHQAMKHLLDLGHKDVLIIRGPPGAQDAQQRLEGCRQAARGGRAKPRCRYIDGYYSPEAALSAFRAFREKEGLPRAVFALNDAMALAIIKELRETGIEVPDEVAVVGFDGIECAEYVGLTTVQVPMFDLGRDAVRLLLDKIRNPQAGPEHVQLEAKLVIRDTCGGKRSQAAG